MRILIIGTSHSVVGQFGGYIDALKKHHFIETMNLGGACHYWHISCLLKVMDRIATFDLVLIDHLYNPAYNKCKDYSDKELADFYLLISAIPTNVAILQWPHPRKNADQDLNIYQQRSRGYQTKYDISVINFAAFSLRPNQFEGVHLAKAASYILGEWLSQVLVAMNLRQVQGGSYSSGYQIHLPLGNLSRQSSSLIEVDYFELSPGIADQPLPPSGSVLGVCWVDSGGLSKFSINDEPYYVFGKDQFVRYDAFIEPPSITKGSALALNESSKGKLVCKPRGLQKLANEEVKTTAFRLVELLIKTGPLVAQAASRSQLIMCTNDELFEYYNKRIFSE
ncbi:hypothetical protein [uncultured Umboniibacter sp.]|uniref:hypothetical protein n=1 Tax=uncultured Umboniibacter sp. TaxID=1798917 RepID=UPI002619E917|nr:hypothetical protein [uncultured Umboniibacter sp.]